jgi:SAM-dependent methyltransferase
LDVGCGRGEMLRLGSAAFGEARGCDLSAEMIRAASDLNVTIQPESTRLPFEDARFDLITAVCVYHHVELAERDALTSEIARLLRPNGTACIIEHNPFNPATQWIVRRTPVDADAKLLTAGATRRLLARAGLKSAATRYFLYFPEKIYHRLRGWEGALAAVPLGGQYAVFARNSRTEMR